MLENAGKVRGLKDVMRPEMDLALEIMKRKQLMLMAIYTVIKVQSHIALDDAPNEPHWRVNEIADTLVTDAQDKVTRGDMCMCYPILLPGARAGAISNGRLVTGLVKAAVHRALYEDTLKHFLAGKYGWSLAGFNTIGWESHESVVGSSPIP